MVRMCMVYTKYRLIVIVCSNFDCTACSEPHTHLMLIDKQSGFDVHAWWGIKWRAVLKTLTQ